MNMLKYSPLPKPLKNEFRKIITYASWNISCKAWPQSGVCGECFSIMELPTTIGGIIVLNGSQNGKFHGIIA
jgi:hypothetical protein